MLPFVSIILPVYNEEKYIEYCLKSLTNLDYPKDCYEIIVVDNGSVDSSLEIASKFTNKVYKIVNVNVGAVRNYGVSQSKGSILAFIDSDCTVEHNWLSYGVSNLEKSPDMVVGGNLRLRENPNWVEKYWLLENKKQPVIQNELLGSCILIRKNHFCNVLGFDENITSGEDTSFSVKLKNIGLIVLIDPTFGVVHLGNPTNVRDFVRRQIWHSENYLLDIKKSMTDKIFYLVLIYLSSFLFFPINLFVKLVNLYLILFVFIAPPLLLSIKRIKKSNFKANTFLEYFLVFVLDNLYLVGRSVGLIRGFSRR